MLHSLNPCRMMPATVLLLAAAAGVAPLSWATEQKSAGQAEGGSSTEAPPKAPAISEEFLNDEKNVVVGKALWQKQCRHCHGKSAYPGKAPKLKPRKYTPDFVYDRVTNGFRKMPPWKAVFSDEERMAITAFVMSKKFSP